MRAIWRTKPELQPECHRTCNRDNDETLVEGLGRAYDHLWPAYVRTHVSKAKWAQCQVALQNSSEPAIAARVKHDVDLLMQATFDDEGSRRKLKKMIEKHPVFRDEFIRQHTSLISLAGLNLDQTTSVAFRIFFLEPLGQEDFGLMVQELKSWEQSNKPPTKRGKGSGKK